MNKLQKLFNNLSYRKKYNTLKVKYESLQEEVIKNILSPFENINTIKKNIDYLKKEYDDIKKRVSNLESKAKK